ncbi:glycoside hydrolase family 35 protein [Annulohypoxylon maeteangense]|uniref:glycoside hydrolase family 35 protein n=1 Tax=Annulohypoxylon maeteangense TaxID=1927788 RepID=UPI002008E471|nr:glycoside hydrolase family 35 protein [Annulohypoxylon maeteangense]KAI0886184.1 glycoside hydrolase family 35 protein [Annulohypoxylon maeteangense]
MLFSVLFGLLVYLLPYGLGLTILPQNSQNEIESRDVLEGLVTWDKHSMIIRGERIFIFSGEFHPWRLPSPGLWLDIFQKIKALGFNAVTFYTYWGLVEGTPGQVRFDGVFALDEFFKAAAEAGIYLIARPGPYINAETALGGFPGWTARIKAPLRGDDPEFVDATEIYAATVGKLIADAQITNGGPVIMLQPENEYDTWPGVNNTDFPAQGNRNYMEHVKQQMKKVGNVVPQMVNDHLYQGNWAPGSGLGETELYGIDAYPMRYDCAHPDVWPKIRWPENWQIMHQKHSPNTPFFIAEFQGGSGTGFGSVNADACNALVNQESVRVLWKNNYSFAIKIFNIYMTYGGTNWGNLGYRGGDSSYDYGAAIKENRHIWREKYSEEKLEANFFKVSPAYLTAVPGNASNGSYVSTDQIATTPVFGTESSTNFYIIRHADWTSINTTTYKFNVPTSIGNISIPQLGGELVLTRRDSKIHVTDYDVGGVNLIYSTAEIFTWARDTSGKRTLILYGGADEVHEFAIDLTNLTRVSAETKFNDKNVKIQKIHSNTLVVQWKVSTERRILNLSDDLEVLLLWRNDAFNYWVAELPAEAPVANYSSPSKSTVVVKGPYLVRTAAIVEETLRLTGDINRTVDIELIYEPTGKVKALSFNDETLQGSLNGDGKLTARLDFQAPEITLPNFATLEWKYIDSLPETQISYDDSAWVTCDIPSTNNPQSLLTPTSLYASDYGFHSGSLIYRGHFTANGEESTLFVNLTGGNDFGYSIWLDDTFITSWDGSGQGGGDHTHNDTISLPSQALENGKSHIFTLVIDHMGQDEEAPGTDAIKAPMGIINFDLAGHSQSDVTWKLTGNLGGESYHDLERGPRNEGAMFAERQGYHQPSPPSQNWEISNPIVDGIKSSGIGFFTTTFDLDVPAGYDVPLNFVFGNSSSTTTTSNYRCQLFVNGWQFGKYVANLGPQTAFPVPEGILNHNGKNTVALTLWSLDDDGAKLDGFSLEPEMPLWSGYRKPWSSPQPAWQEREGAY